MRAGPVGCWLLALVSAGCVDAAARPTDASGVELEANDADRGFWIEQPRVGEIGVDWPPPQTVVELELDASLARGARVELFLDGEMLWDGNYTEPLGVALPAGEHKMGVTVVAAEGAGRAETTFESSRGCRVRLTASKQERGVRLEQSVDCGSGSARALE